MKKIQLNAFVNIVAFIAVLISLVSGIVLWQALPHGSGFRGGRGFLAEQFFWGLDRSAWLDLHYISSLAFGILVIYHLILHWNWIKCLPKIFSRKKGTECKQEEIYSQIAA